MSLSKEAERKISGITYKTNISGHYQYDSKEEAASIINLFQQYMNDDGSFKKTGHDVHCDPIYQELSAAIDYYKFGIKREPNIYSKPRPRKNNTKNNTKK
jgi:hypothetical protein